jgi:hypothetical protein
VSEKVIYKGTKREQVKTTTKNFTLLNGSTYKPDFKIWWTEKSRGIFFIHISSTRKIIDHEAYFISDIEKCQETKKYYEVSYVDVKSPFRGKNQSDVSFSLNRKIVMEKYGIFINKSINYPTKKMKNPKSYLWVDTFTPRRYLFTNKQLGLRSIRNWIVRTLTEFIKLKEDGKD